MLGDPDPDRDRPLHVPRHGQGRRRQHDRRRARYSVVAWAQTSAGGTVPATLALTLGAPASFGAFIPGVPQVYTASTTATVVSTAGDATLTVTDPSTTHPGRLVNGTFALPQPLLAAGQPLPATVKTWSAPTSNEAVPVAFTQRDRRQ